MESIPNFCDVFLLVLYLEQRQKKYFSDQGRVVGGSGELHVVLASIPNAERGLLMLICHSLHSILTIFANISDLYCMAFLLYHLASFVAMSIRSTLLYYFHFLSHSHLILPSVHGMGPSKVRKFIFDLKEVGVGPILVLPGVHGMDASKY